jgi:hypothetical protein
MSEKTFQAVEVDGREATTVWRNRIRGYGMTRVADAVANPNNWKIHTKDQFDVLDGGLAEVGIVQNIIINVTTGNMVDGHGRILHALKKGEEYWPTTFVELSRDEENKVLMILDPVAAMAATDEEKAVNLASVIETESDAIKALMARITAAEDDTKKKPESATEFNFTRELKEKQNYVLFAFDNEFDFNVVVEAFGIKTAHSLDSRPGYERAGIGRVLDGQKLLALLGA